MPKPHRGRRFPKSKSYKCWGKYWQLFKTINPHLPTVEILDVLIDLLQSPGLDAVHEIEKYGNSLYMRNRTPRATNGLRIHATNLSGKGKVSHGAA